MRSEDASQDLAANMTLTVTRPHSPREWAAWYSRRDKARRNLAVTAVERYPRDVPAQVDWLADMLAVCGLDVESEQDMVRRWGGPPHPNRPTPTGDRQQPADTADAATPEPSPAAGGPAPTRTAAAGDIDDVLMERARAGDRTAAAMLTPLERETLAGRMFLQGRSITAICKALHVSGGEAAKLVGTYRRDSTAGAA